MARVNFNSSEISGKCQGLAGMKCEEYHTHIATINNDALSCTKNNGSRAMHISFSGYYGYLPHVQSTASDFEMDTTDAVGSPCFNGPTAHCYDQSNIQLVNESVMNAHFSRRKRNLGDTDQIDVSKRLRKEETVGLVSPQERVLPTTNNNDFHYPRCLMEQETINGKDTECSQRFINEEYDSELEDLLKQTHGCDLYHFYSCDI